MMRYVIDIVTQICHNFNKNLKMNGTFRFLLNDRIVLRREREKYCAGDHQSRNTSVFLPNHVL